MKKFLQSLLILSLVVILAGMPVWATPSIGTMQQEKAEAETEVEQLQKNLSDILGKIDKTELDIMAKGEEIEQVDNDLEDAIDNEVAQYNAMKLRIRFMYEEGDNTMLIAVLESSSMSELMNKAEYIQDVHTYDRRMLDEYVAAKQLVIELKTELEKQYTQLQELEAELETEKTQLDTLIADKQEEIKLLDEKIQEAVRLAEEQRRREAEARAAAAAAAAAGNSTSSSSSAGSVATPPPYTGTPNASKQQQILNAAYYLLSIKTPYVLGGNDPNTGLDCSGLTRWCYAQAGISIPRNSETQYSSGRSVSREEALPGDIYWRRGHVGIYIGNGQIIHAPEPGRTVEVGNARTTSGRPEGFVRYW
ncbi:MAG: C40 family peptidase [Lachnospiraceae bacterium]|jgi:cell wall-associated NlpC family hydrolase|nr:C40 family peptidase [Lachnospiraceae bacterium]